MYRNITDASFGAGSFETGTRSVAAATVAVCMYICLAEIPPESPTQMSRKNSLKNFLNHRLIVACIDGDLQKIKEMIELGGADVNYAGDNGGTPLHFAVKFDQIEVVKYLLEEAHANPNSTDAEENTPLLTAARLHQFDTAQLLVQHGADPCCVHSEESPLHRAAKSGKSSFAKFLLHCPDVDVNALDAKGNTPLHFAMMRKETEMVRVLIDYGADTGKIGTVQEIKRRYQNSSDKFVLIEEAADRRHRAELFMSLHGWRSLIDVVSNELDMNIMMGENVADQANSSAYVKHRQTRLRKLYNELHAIDLRLSLADTEDASHKDLTSEKSHLEKQLLLFCQSMNISWKGRNEFLHESPKVFLSHTGQHPFSAAFTEFLSESLEKKYDISTFLDSTFLEAGRRWEQDIEYCATNCRVFVCILSKPYFSRYWCMRELDLALRSGRCVLVVCHSCMVPDLDDHAKNQLSTAIAKHHGYSDDILLLRFADNLQVLKGNQGIHNDFASKHSQVPFRDKVIDEIVKKLQAA